MNAPRKAAPWLLVALCSLGATRVLADQTAEFSGSLAGVPCRSAGDLELVGDAYVSAGDRVVCASTGGEIRIRGLSVEGGASFRARVGRGVESPWADTGCSASSADCNVCARDVHAQFGALFGSALPRGAFTHKETESWSFRPGSDYDPSHRRASEALTGGLGRHVQGFVRTNDGFFPYAGTYSDAHDQAGSIFFVSREAFGSSLDLNTLHEAWGYHPTGMSVLGAYVLFGDYSGAGTPWRGLRVMGANGYGPEAYLAFEPWDEHGETRDINMGGGVGMVKLASGGHLLVATGPGGPQWDAHDIFQDNDGHDNPRYTDFFYLAGSPQREGSRSALGVVSQGRLDLEVQHLGRFYQDVFGRGAAQKKYQYSENLTLIPECGTGDIYVVHMSSTPPDAANQGDKPGYFRLSRIDWSNQGPELEILDVYEVEQSWDSCMPRAAASAWVSPAHEIELYCSELRASAGEEAVHFERRWVEY